LAHIARENIKGVVFVDGDPHFTELSMLTNEKGNKVYDLTCSSLTAGSFTDAATKTQNANRVEGTLVNTHNFALLQFSGPRTARVLTVSVFDNKGNELWKKVLQP
jgi:alkaline phosphatase D